jgi:spermidine synthase
VFSKEKRLSLMFRDGLAFVKNAKDGAYDLIVVDSTDPEGPGGSLFTEEFYTDCYRILSDDGILINQQESAFYNFERLHMISAHAKVKKVFPIAKVYGFNIPTYSSGYWYFGFASKKFDPISDHKPGEWESLGIKTRYYNKEIHKACFALPNYVKEILL